MAKPSVVALIPARSGSKRVSGKNLKMLGGVPLIAHTIRAATASGVFSEVIVSTDSGEIAAAAKSSGASVPFMRPAQYAGDLSPDIEWVRHVLETLAAGGRKPDAFSILRPTSPFRTEDTIRRAWTTFISAGAGVDSLRAVEKCGEHPCKMWVVRGGRLLPLIPFGPEGQPWHSTPYQALPEIYVQNASLEIAWTRVVFETNSIAGSTIVPFFTQGREGFDINTPEDWIVAEKILAEGV